MITLEAIPLFQNLNTHELQILARITQERSFAPDQEIFRENDSCDGLYVVKVGRVRIVAGSGEGRVFSTLGPGKFFGEMAVIENNSRSASVVAEDAVTTFFVPRAELIALMEGSPGLAMELLRQVSQRLREFNELHLRELVQEESLAIIGRFAQSIVHDLKNPLSIISLSAQMIAMESAGPDARAKARERILKQADRISDMVGDILVFTKNPRFAVEMRAVDYATFIAELAEDLRAQAETKSSKIELENIPPSVPVKCDPRRLGRVLFNLIRNSTDAMPEGGKIILRFRVDGGEIITEIEDTGPGISPQIAEHLFHPFSTHGKAHGTGLGLSICKRIIADHGGKIFTRIEPGRGAIFCFTLPVAGMI